MRVFISWSGDVSHQAAKALHEWLPMVLNNVEPFVSSEDISKGARGLSSIASELSTARYGIICLTKQNISAPWVNFEAGALSNKFDAAKVSPILINLQRHEIPAGSPLLQFQNTQSEYDDMHKLLTSLNTELTTDDRGLTEVQLTKAFGKWWPELESRLKKARDSERDSTDSPLSGSPDHQMAMIAELLDLARSTYKLIERNDPSGPLNLLMDLFARESLTTVHRLHANLNITLSILDEIIRSESDMAKLTRERLVHASSRVRDTIDGLGSLSLASRLQPRGRPTSAGMRLLSHFDALGDSADDAASPPS